MRHTKETKQAIRQYCLDCIVPDDETIRTDEEKAAHAYNRFLSEYGHEIKHRGFQAACGEWLSGLALNIDFYNCDILQLAAKWGQPVETERQQERIVEQWFPFMALQYCKLFREFKLIA